jgi:hypothetical protein
VFRLYGSQAHRRPARGFLKTGQTEPDPNDPVVIQVRQNMIFRPSGHLAYAGNKNTIRFRQGSFACQPLPTNTAQANNFSRIADEPDNQSEHLETNRTRNLK